MRPVQLLREQSRSTESVASSSYATTSFSICVQELEVAALLRGEFAHFVLIPSVGTLKPIYYTMYEDKRATPNLPSASYEIGSGPSNS